MSNSGLKYAVDDDEWDYFLSDFKENSNTNIN